MTASFSILTGGLLGENSARSGAPWFGLSLWPCCSSPPTPMWAATLASGMLGGASTSLIYSGTTATVNPANFDSATCQTAGYCDVFALTFKCFCRVSVRTSKFPPKYKYSVSTDREHQ